MGYAEAKINLLPQYTTSIPVPEFGQLGVHFVLQQSPVKPAMPLLFCHGCELAARLASKPLDLLAFRDEYAPAFHVVAPSLPNFGFSEAVKERGFRLDLVAEVCINLMVRLGYVTHGGDWICGPRQLAKINWLFESLTQARANDNPHYWPHPSPHLNRVLLFTRFSGRRLSGS